MAIDKSRTSPLMKTMIIILAGVFILGIGFTGLAAMPSCSVNAPLLPGGGTTGSTSASTATTASITQKWSPQVAAIEASLTAAPKDYNLLLTQAESYFGWASDMQQLDANSSPIDNPLWKTSSTYFARAISVNASEAATFGDYAITLFYSGDTTGAITAGETAKKLDPTIVQNLYNLGNYYAAAGDKAKAVASWEAYISAAPTGNLVPQAKQNIAGIGQ